MKTLAENKLTNENLEKCRGKGDLWRGPDNFARASQFEENELTFSEAEAAN